MVHSTVCTRHGELGISIVCLFFDNADSGSGASIEDSSDVTINIRELDDVLMKDVGKKIAESGK